MKLPFLNQTFPCSFQQFPVFISAEQPLLFYPSASNSDDLLLQNLLLVFRYENCGSSLPPFFLLLFIFNPQKCFIYSLLLHFYIKPYNILFLTEGIINYEEIKSFLWLSFFEYSMVFFFKYLIHEPRHLFYSLISSSIRSFFSFVRVILWKVMLNVFNDRLVGQTQLICVQFMHVGFCVDYENGLHLDACMKIGNRIILTISQTTDKRINFWWKQLFDFVHQISLDIASFFHNLFLNCRQKLLWLCQKNSLDSYCVPDVLLENSYRGRDRMVIQTILQPFDETFCMSYAQPSCRKSVWKVLLSIPPRSFLVRVPSTSLIRILSAQVKRCIQALIRCLSSQQVIEFLPYLSFMVLTYQSPGCIGWLQPCQSNWNSRLGISEPLIQRLI